MSQPSELPRWADSGAVIVDPPSGIKDVGNLGNSFPRAEYFNWWMNLVYQWVIYLAGLAAEDWTWTGSHVFTKGLTATQSAANTRAIATTGNGTGRGINAVGGNDAEGGSFTAGGGNRAGASALGSGTGGGFEGTGGTNGNGTYGSGGSLAGFGAAGDGASGGGGFTGRGANSPGVVATGGPTGVGEGLRAIGGSGGGPSIVAKRGLAASLAPLEIYEDASGVALNNVDHLGLRTARVSEWREEWWVPTPSVTDGAGNDNGNGSFAGGRWIIDARDNVGAPDAAGMVRALQPNGGYTSRSVQLRPTATLDYEVILTTSCPLFRPLAGRRSVTAWDMVMPTLPGLITDLFELGLYNNPDPDLATEAITLGNALAGVPGAAWVATRISGGVSIQSAFGAMLAAGSLLNVRIEIDFTAGHAYLYFGGNASDPGLVFTSTTVPTGPFYFVARHKCSATPAGFMNVGPVLTSIGRLATMATL